MPEQQKNNESGFRTSIGGQALIEGIMMRGPKKQAIVIRAPGGAQDGTPDGVSDNTPDGVSDNTQDEFVIKVEELKLIKDKYPILGVPIIRGAVNFISSMINGVKALMFAASCMPEDMQEEESKVDKWIEKHVGGEKAEKLIIGLAVVLGIGMAVLLFFMLPTFLAGMVSGFVKSGVVKNLIEGAIRIVIFISYMALATKMKEIKRVWAYHGAEHKTIFCYEKGLDLTVENVREQPRCHPRCGTSFMLIVMIISILVFSVVSWSNVWMRMGLRILLLPVVVGISYEIIKWAGRHDNIFTRIISAPGKALQRLTTREPDDDMIEVAIKALELVLPQEKGLDKW